MEAILMKLQVANSKTVQEATLELKEAFRKPEAVLALCDVIVTSQSPQIRQTAAVILRRRLGRKRHWTKLNVDIRNRIKQGMIQALVNEPEKAVKNSIAQFIGTLGKYEFPDKSWPELLQFIHTLCSCDNQYDRELGMYTLSIMTEISHVNYSVHVQSFAALFTTILNSSSEPYSNVNYYTLITMKNIASVLKGTKQMINLYQNLMPRILQIIHAFSSQDEKRACEIFELLEELIEYAVVIIVPHIKPIIEMCLQIGSDNSMPTTVQIKAISVVGWLIRSKGKVIQKNRLVEPVIEILLRLMAQPPDDEGQEEYFLGDPDQFTTTTIATQTLDLLALHIPADKVVPCILSKIETVILNDNIYAQKAAYLSLAVLAEGCSEYIRNKYLEQFLKFVCGAIHNPNAVVRNAALFALGQFAEHLQPEISKYAAELLPVLFECLSQIFAQMEIEKKDPPSLGRLFYALETFCENLEEALMPYLPTLMDRLFVALEPNGWSMQLKRVALSLLGSVASAVKEGLMEYFAKIIEVLNVYINSDPNLEIHQLQCYAIESLAVVAQFIGADNFRPLASQSLELGLGILNQSHDPDVRKSVYGLFAALAIVLKGEIGPVLPNVVEQMINSIQSSEGIVVNYDEEKEDEVNLYGDLSEDEDADEEDIDDASSSASADSTQCRYSVENSYNEEKEQACLALKEICLNTGVVFLPYIEKSFEEILKLINYPQDDIRKVSVEALLQFCVTLHEINTNETKDALYKALQMFIPKCAELIRVDEERSIVILCLDAFGTLLEEVKGDVLVGEGHREAIMNCVIDVLQFKTYCQDNDETPNMDEDENETESEGDELLLESAGDVIPKFAAAITPDDFVSYFPNVLELMTTRTKKQNSLSQRSFAYGTLAECMKSLSLYVEKFVPTLLHLWLTGARDSADEVRNNAIFGLGEMILHGKEKVFGKYPEILQALSVAVTKESHAGTLDNICGALAKMIIVNANGIPLDQVFPAFLQRLPLRDDFAENEAVINCFFSLYQQGNQILKQYLSEVINILVHICYKEQTPNDETKMRLIEFLKIINRDFSEEFGKSVSSLGPEATEAIQKLFMT